jgi:hypothetical protein
MSIGEKPLPMAPGEVERLLQLLAQATAQFNPYPFPQFVTPREAPKVLYVTRLSHNSTSGPKE